VYTAAPGENGGFILKHSTGHLPGNSEVDVPLTYADYYFIEAMMRYKALKTKK
jgi:unsaturated chondroitin disaccharide hydrolase